MEAISMQIVNTMFGSTPLVIHAHGSHDYKPNWLPIRDAFFSLAPGKINSPEHLTIITCNNGHPSMGMFERSLDHLGIPYQVFGQGIEPWVNALDKPKVLHEALGKIKTNFVMYADSRDAILIGDPAVALDIFHSYFQCKLLFGADRINWPPIPEFQKYEDQLAAEYNTEFRYFNGGTWIGETDFSRKFFEDAMNNPPLDKAPESEQGILKKLFPLYEEDIQLDYHCRIFQNIGFVTAPIFNIKTQPDRISVKR